MRGKYQGSHIDQGKAVYNGVRSAFGKAGRSILAVALVCLLFPANSLALDAATDGVSPSDMNSQETDASPIDGGGSSTEAIGAGLPDSSDEETADDEVVLAGSRVQSNDAGSTVKGALPDDDRRTESDGAEGVLQNAIRATTMAETGQAKLLGIDASEDTEGAEDPEGLESDEESEIPPNDVSISISALAGGESLHPYKGEDTIYCSDDVTLSVQVTGLQARDVVDVTAGASYSGLANQKTVGSDSDSYAQSIVLNPVEGGVETYSGLISVAVTRDGGNIAEEKFENSVVIDQAPPVVRDFKFDIEPALIREKPDGYGGQVICFNLDSDHNGTATDKVKLSATIEDANLESASLVVRGLEEDLSEEAAPVLVEDGSVASSGIREVSVEFEADDFLNATQNAIQIAKAYIEAKDKAGNESSHYPSVAADSEEPDSIMLTAADGFTAENALLGAADIAVTPSYTLASGAGEAQPAKRVDDSSLYFKESVNLSSIAFGVSDDSLLKSSEVEAGDYELVVDGTPYQIGANYGNGLMAISTPVAFSALEDGVKKYEEVFLKVTSGYGATRTIRLPSVVIDDTHPSITAELNSKGLTSRKVGDADQWIYDGMNDGAIAPEVTVELRDTFSLTSTDDVLLTFSDGSSDIVVRGDDSITQWVDDGEGNFWKAVVNIGEAIKENTLFKANTAYQLKSVTAKTIFSEELIEADMSADPLLFYVDAIDPVVTISFPDVIKTAPDQDGSSWVIAVISKVVAEANSGIVITVEDETFDATDMETNVVKVNNAKWDIAGWSQVGGSKKQYMATIAYEKIPEGNELTLSVDVSDLAGHRTRYSYAEPSKQGSTQVNGSSYDEGWQYFVKDTSPVQYEGFALYADEDCTELAKLKTTVDGVDYFDYATIYGKLTVSDANFSTKLSTVNVRIDGEITASLTGSDWKRSASPDDDDKYYVTYAFGEGNLYTLDLVANDITGSEEINNQHNDTLLKSDIVARPFTIDHSCPNVSVTMNEKPVSHGEDAASDNKAEVDWYAHNVTARISVTDANLDSATLKAIPSCSTKRPLNSTNQGEWKKNGTAYECEIVFQDNEYDAASMEAYGLAVGLSDVIGHATTYHYGDNEDHFNMEYGEGRLSTTVQGGAITKRGAFVVDTKAPDVSVVFDVPRSSQKNAALGTNSQPELTDYYASNVQAAITVTDVHFDVAASRVVDAAGSQLTQASSWVSNGDGSWTTVVEFADNAYGEASTLNVFVQDSIHALDASFGHTTNYAYGDNAVAAEDASAGARATFALDDSLKAAYAKRFIVDTVAPSIAIMFEQQVSTHDGDTDTDYYVDVDSDGFLIATVRVKDANFDASTASVTPLYGEAVQGDDGLWTMESPGVYRAQVKYSDTPIGKTADLDIEVEDLTGAEGHKVSYGYGDDAIEGGAAGGSVSTTANGKVVAGSSFIVDTTPLSMSIVIAPTSKNSVTANGIVTDYYKSSVRATITVTDVNFNPITSQILTVAENGANKVVTPGVSGWRLVNGLIGEYQYDLLFGKDNEFGETYTFTVFAYDKGYRTGADFHPEVHSIERSYRDVEGMGERFVIDTVAPMVDVTIDQELVGTEDGVDYYGTVGNDGKLTASITVTDNNFDAQAIIQPSEGEVLLSGPSVWSQVVEDGQAQPKWVASVKFGETRLNAVCDLGTISVTDYAGLNTQYAYGLESDCGATKTRHGVNASETISGQHFIVDVTAPTMVVNFMTSEGEDVSPSWVDSDEKVAYYSKRPTAIVTVKDRHFDSNTAISVIESLGYAGFDSLAWIRGDDADDVAVWSATIPFVENLKGNDLPYSSLKVSALDKIGMLAGQNGSKSENSATWLSHRADWSYSDAGSGADVFVADETAPVIKVSINKQINGTNGATDYYDSDVQATIIVKDRDNHIAETKGVVGKNGASIPGIEVVVTKDGVANSDIVVGNWEKSSEDSDHNVTWTGTIPFSGEACSHSFSVVVLDKALNKSETNYSDASSQGSSAFVIDKTDPSVSFTLDERKQGTDDSGVDYFSNTVTASILVVDDNFKPADSVVVVDGKVRNDVQWLNPAEDGRTYLALVEYGEGSKHTLDVRIADWASRSTPMAYGNPIGDSGNDKIGGSVDSSGVALLGKSFTIDLTKPKVSYEVNQKKAATHDGIDYFSNIETGDNQAVITVTINELNFNPDSALNVISKNGAEQQSVTWRHLRSTIWTAEIAFDEGADNMLDVVVGDWANNTQSCSYGASTVDSTGKGLSSSTFAVDLTAPVVKSASTNADYSGNYGTDFYFWNTGTKLVVKVTDNIGLRSVSLVDQDGFYGHSYIASETESGARSDNVVVAFADGHEFDRDIQLETVDLAYNSRIWSIAPNGQVTDVTGSRRANAEVIEGAHPKGLVKDTVDPKMSFSGVEAGRYYNASQTVTLDVNELNFRYLRSYDVMQRVIRVNKVAGNADASEDSWDVTVSDFSTVNKDQKPSGLDGLYRYSETFENDGHYSLSARLEDPAGNTVSATQGEFTIDKTPPTVRVEFDNNNAMNGNYYNAGRVATVTVTEHNFSASMINLDTTGTIGSWIDDGDTHTITVSFGADGNHNLSISGSDLAGNELQPYSVDQFTVDTTAPTIAISFIGADSEDQRAFNGVVQPVIAFSDEANYNGRSASFSIEGNKVGNVSDADGVEYGFVRNESGNGETITYYDFAHAIEVDDIYTITATLSDMAGNEAARATETFSVNRFGSNYIVESPASVNGDSSDLGYLPEAPDITIREINVAGVQERSVAVTHNLKTTNLPQRTETGEPGYVVRDVSSNANYGWQEYDYTISKESFAGEGEGASPDGNYVVVLSSKDATGNTNSSANFWVSKDDERKSADAGEEETDTEKRMSAAVKFTLDTLPPEVVGLSVDNNEVIDAVGAQEVTFIATDNIGFSEKDGVSVIVDGQKADYSIDGSGKVSFVVPEQPGRFQPIQIQVADFAGNKFMQGVVESGQEAFAIKVTSDFFDLHMPLIVGGGIAVIVAAAAIGFFFVRPRMASRVDGKATVK